MSVTSTAKTALVHHWLTTRRGGERVLEALTELFPHADIFTLVCDRDRLPPALHRYRIRPSFLQRLPRATEWYPYYLPLFPWATERLDLSGYQLVISSDAATLKGARVNSDALHICYCHTPMRYVWSGYETYRRSAGLVGKLAYPLFANWLRQWDYRAAQRVTHFVANSQNVADRIQLYYRRDSTVIYPPVDTDYFAPAASPPTTAGYFLVVSQLIPYKCVDLVVEAFNRCNWPLRVIGEGKERQKLERQARSNIRFLGYQLDSELRQAMQDCRALVFPGEEDFGLVMAEAQACGRPVIAFAQGGAREIVRDGVTGILFEEQSVDSLLEALERYNSSTFDADEIRAFALKFNRKRFLREFSSFVEQACEVGRDCRGTENHALGSPTFASDLTGRRCRDVSFPRRVVPRNSAN